VVLSAVFFFNAWAISGAEMPKCDGDLKTCEEGLGTAEESLAIYHHVVREPRGKNSKLNHEGYLIGIEKADTEIIGTQRGLDTTRFHITKGWMNQGRMQHLNRVTNDGKKMFVSHLVAFDPVSRGTKTRFIHSAYPLKSDFKKSPRRGCPAIDPKATFYEQGWKALDVLECELKEKFKEAHEREAPYSHLIVISMGWNNDQEESVWRFNQIIGNLKKAAPSDGRFKPMVVAISWPSVWFSEADWAAVRGFAHLSSYGNKSDDADEIGYTYANHTVNLVARGLKSGQAFPAPKIILIGHSMGARFISRAAFSAPLLKDTRPAQLPKVELVLGLQSAFSVNRFVKGHMIPYPFRFIRYGEGYPYAGYAQAVGQVVLTWSEEDDANPLAALVTGAKHAGGRYGFDESLEEDKRRNFLQVVYDPEGGGAWRERRQEGEGGKKLSCRQMRDKKKVLMVDASDFVKDTEMLDKDGGEKKFSGHNDILDIKVGRLIWASMTCFAK
jgi:pimeloyl-ACP methyl ester carboxylesterase